MTFDPQPSLSDSLVRLRPLKATDWDTLYGVAGDPLVWALHPARDRWMEPVFRDLFAQSLESGGALVIEDAQTGAVIGSSRYSASRVGEDEIEIGWTFLARSHWGGEYNRSVKRLMLAHALSSFERVIFLIGVDNLRSRRAIEKIGAELVGQRALPVGEQLVEHAVYAVTREGFRGNPLI
jgi:RimJ/RimL family protein N-acetyltransferase